jgi:hypothetical protein
MSKSKYGHSNLYMTTREFADLVIEALDEQNYFKDDEAAHPEDISHAFCTIAQTIGSTMQWAIKQEHEHRKQAVMSGGNLKKAVLPVDDEISPIVEDDSVGYSDWRHDIGYM